MRALLLSATRAPGVNFRTSLRFLYVANGIGFRQTDARRAVVNTRPPVTHSLLLSAALSVRRWENRSLRKETRKRERREHSTDATTTTSILSQTTSLLRNLDNGAEIFLVGTAHVSRRSAEEVSALIDVVRPDAVMIELCAGRAKKLMEGGVRSDGEFLREMLGSLLAPGGSFGEKMFKLSFSGFYRFLRSLGLNPGGEFRAAIEGAERHGARLVYGDRDVNETMKRLASSIDFEDVLRLVSTQSPNPPQHIVDYFENNGGNKSQEKRNTTIEDHVEALKTRAMARDMAHFLREASPKLAQALIDERDEILTKSLRKLQGRVVGVVGLAHLDGIERRWESLQKSKSAVLSIDGLVRERSLMSSKND